MKPTSLGILRSRSFFIGLVGLTSLTLTLPSCFAPGRTLEYPGGPLATANLPVGWPAPGPLGRVAVKRYPTYRSAVKEGFSEGDATLSLYAHASKSNIPLSAPIENIGFFDERGNWKLKSVSYLYPSVRVGTTGIVEDTVVVRDNNASVQISFAWSGGDSPADLLTAKTAIDGMARSRGFQPSAYRLLTYDRYPRADSPKIRELQTSLPH